MEKATFAGGCFWCVEAPFELVEGVESVTSGYTGGETPNPTYDEVCSGKTGHAEAVLVVYDPDVVTYRELLEVFFAIHDPTTRDRQGPDIGSQYRSAVFYHDDGQRETAEEVVEELEGDVYEGIVTELSPTEEFYEAEEYHQNYYEQNPQQPYCRVHIPSKLEKVRDRFGDIVASD